MGDRQIGCRSLLEGTGQGCWTVLASCWTTLAGCWALVTGLWLLVTGLILLVGKRLLR